MKGLALAISLLPLAVVGGGKDIYGDDLTRTNLLGYVDGGETSVGDVADFAITRTNEIVRLAGSGLLTNGLAASYIRQSNNCRDYNSFCGPTHFIGGIHTWNTNVVKFTKSDTGPTSTLKPDGTPVLTEGSATNFVKTIAEDSSVTNAGAVAESKDYTDTCCSTLAVASTNVAYKAITNAVTSGYLCTVAAAQQKATQAKNEAISDASYKYLPLMGTSGGNIQWSDGFLAVSYPIAANAFYAIAGWDCFRYGMVDSYQTLPSYLDSLAWRTTGNRTLANYGITNAVELYKYVDKDWINIDSICTSSGSDPNFPYGLSIIYESNGGHLYPSLGGLIVAINGMASELSSDGTPFTTSNMVVGIVSSSAASKATEATVSEWETYWRGDRVRLSVTNYYGNTSGESPRLRIEEFDHSTTNGTVVSNFYHVVWDEIDRQTNYMAQTDAKVSGISNAVMDAAWRQTNLQLVNKAPRAWQSVTSAGEDAPPNMVWHTAPQSVFAGGTEYAHVAVGEGTICVLTDKGAPVYTDGAEGQFRFQDQSGQNYFGFDVRSSYKIGCRTDGISVNSQQHIVSLTYDLTSATNPSILHSTNLVDWADAVVEWEQNPPEGTKVCYINCGNDPKGFYQAEIRYAGGSKFLTNMQADLMGGIAASNQTLNVIQSVEPYIISNQVMWRVKQ